MKVLAVVVTHNRLNDLKVCIDAIRHQSYKDLDIFVSDNGSTDGTKEWLDAEPDLIVLHQGNVGGAGGFYAGQKYAMDNGYEWVWMMDDDGIADKDELKELMVYKDTYAFLNALVINRDDHSKLSFGGPWNDGIEINDLEEVRKQPVWDDYACTFNGTLIKRSVLEQCGLIKKEMFIWGDETEFSKRLLYKGGYPERTITNAIHYHPAFKGKVAYPYPWNKKVVITLKPSHMSKYFYRNQGYIARTYGHGGRGSNKPWWASHLANKWKYSFYFITRFQWGELIKYHYYWAKGYNNKYDSI